MPLLAIAVTALLPAAAAAPARPRGLQSAEQCPRTTSYQAWDHSKPPPPRKLSELPDANVYAAVYRTVGGCEVPVLVRYGISGRR